VIDGIRFASRMEARRYDELKALHVADIHIQPKFEIQPPVVGNPALKRGILYWADFLYMGKDGVWVVEDVKGMRLETFVLKMKIFLYQRRHHSEDNTYELLPKDMVRNKISGCSRFVFAEV
jgi:hypothetical protein